MSKAEELLNNLSTNDISLYTTDPENEGHIVIDNERFVSVPEPLQRIAVQYDHNIETVTFDCPRYWDEHDLMDMYIYINYQRPDEIKGKCIAKNVMVDEENPDMIHFDWVIGQEIVLVEGPLEFLVCAVQCNSLGEEIHHWNSEINDEMYVSRGLETEDDVIERNPSIITDLQKKVDDLVKEIDELMSKLTGTTVAVDGSLTLPGVAADAAVVGKKFDQLDANAIVFEEGAFTPTITTNSKSLTITGDYRKRIGKYYKMGNMVYFYIEIETEQSIKYETATDSDTPFGKYLSEIQYDNITIDGLPYIQADTSSESIDWPVTIAKLTGFEVPEDSHERIIGTSGDLSTYNGMISLYVDKMYSFDDNPTAYRLSKDAIFVRDFIKDDDGNGIHDDSASNFILKASGWYRVSKSDGEPGNNPQPPDDSEPGNSPQPDDNEFADDSGSGGSSQTPGDSGSGGSSQTPDDMLDDSGSGGSSQTPDDSEFA